MKGLIMNRGFTDQASEIDSLNIESYYKGLSQFIISCNTPMTIGIQGDWGTGKTSIMKMIDLELKKKSSNKVKTLWFNTWQFSQFDMGNDLALSLISTLLSSMIGVEGKKNNVQQVFGVVSKAAKQLSLMALDSKLGPEFSEIVKSAISGEEKDFDLPAAVTKLKDDFGKIVKLTLANEKLERFVIFVDDLDRLQPAKAVELLEVLKLFLDIENCVFVLAIDYQVVLTGVASKYGRSIGEDKGKSFFDKIIQVPFKMPIAHYDISKFVEQCFEDIGIEIKGTEELEIYKSMIFNTIGYNPRSMKRLFNAFLLLTHIAGNKLLDTRKSKQILFGFLCLQQSNDVMYDYIIREREQIEDIWTKINSSEDPEIKDMMNEKKISEKKQNQFFLFMEDFSKMIDTDGDNKLSQEEKNSLLKVLDFSTITSADSQESIKKYTPQPLKSLNELLHITNTIPSVQTVYQNYSERIREIAGVDLEERFYGGQTAVSFIIKTNSGRIKKFCEIKLMKTSMTIYFIFKADSNIIEKVNQIRPNIHNTIGKHYTQINGIVNSDNFSQISDLIKLTYDNVFYEKKI